MYKKALGFLSLINILFLVGLFCVDEINSLMPSQNMEEVKDISDDCGMDIAQMTISEPRVVEFTSVEGMKEIKYNLSEDEYAVLCRIVEAEAGCEDEIGKMLVAGVVLNRVNDKQFPDSVKEVVFQQDDGITQFSPIESGSYYNVKISKETKNAVNKVLYGEDYTDGALFFVARSHANPGKMEWFDTKLEFLFSYGGHEFFTNK